MIIWSVYIITNKPNGVLYIGVTKDLKIRIYQHKNKSHPNTFSARYNLDKLIYFENYKTKDEAYTCERRMKKWNREWKIKLIEKENKDWADLSENLIEYLKKMNN
ncbi:GIY-YIG nuclease family protein [Aquimarina sp. 2201CG5-10]|uniref:GIY-YIG nuclease family protein n=1 Tax=Aquimarina callyspongiae TaxID=3098150 RepID=UPI002AB4C390|nr:GIY-YIG nuclease family protein [Aquimarina sp. 2201CG5-10]MDY8134578.1 GIY-YIG nuclease family protein [Aquimarina sp. 2201CG5-10]